MSAVYFPGAFDFLDPWQLHNLIPAGFGHSHIIERSGYRKNETLMYSAPTTPLLRPFKHVPHGAQNTSEHTQDVQIQMDTNVPASDTKRSRHGKTRIVNTEEQIEAAFKILG